MLHYCTLSMSLKQWMVPFSSFCQVYTWLVSYELLQCLPSLNLFADDHLQLCSPWINHGADDLGTYSSFSPGSTVHAKFKSLAIWETTSMTPPCALLQAESWTLQWCGKKKLTKFLLLQGIWWFSYFYKEDQCLSKWCVEGTWSTANG